MHRRTAPLASALVLVLVTGCRNPFEPSSDIELTTITASGWGGGQNNGSTVLVHATDAASATVDLNRWRTSIRVVIRNKVDVYLTSASIVYTDLDGNEVTSYRSIGGRNLKFTIFCRGVQGSGEFDETEGSGTTFDLFIVDVAVLRELQSPAYPDTNVMFANLVLRGEDANGYDVRLEGQLTIQYIE